MTDQPSCAGQDLPGSAESAIPSPRSSTDSRPPHARHPSMHLSHLSSTTSPHRHGFRDSLHGIPQSPRARRPQSMTQAAIQDLIDNPPVQNPADPAFSGRDWRQISIGELVSPDDLKFVEVDTGIEEATNVRLRCLAPA